ncbi:mechanosensitive ion channel family protein [Magnetospira sp. QH-2]|uniref:mechanosensitive ion channel family protein n=1 Tax=Magnetospira sp. (strain QH-2) TaxID=1288970 RepID=UPI0003E80DFF|nr:mechanosensitive ion channel domain-containing protein [Magnetospira sp. QH-2]CCQ73275.1 Small-conductance mechanosensitive channel [Magnetospira sp. QH-2]
MDNMDMEQMQETIQAVIEEVVTMVTSYGLDVIGAIGILIIGWIVSGWARGAVNKGLSKFERFDSTLRGFFSSIVKYLVLTFTLVAVLGQFGIQTASIIAALGAVGLAIGLALQGTLSNVAAGVMLLIFRPFKVGDYIDAGGHAGTVKALNLFTTDLATPDNVHIVMPNGQIWGGSVTNYSYHNTRRVDFLVGIGYGANMDQAISAIESVITADSRSLKDPAHQVVVSNLGDSSVDITVRVWVRSSDYWGVKFDLTKAFKEKLDAEGIDIPFPQRVVHMVQPD